MQSLSWQRKLGKQRWEGGSYRSPGTGTHQPKEGEGVGYRGWQAQALVEFIAQAGFYNI